MANVVISDNLKDEILKFLKRTKKADLITTYLYFLEKKFNIRPVLFAREKTIYQSREDLIERLEKDGKLWRETEIKIQVGQQSVNDQTKKIYICPFTGKVFGDNTHPNPQDAIYDWVSKCPENTERAGGLRVKRFFVSEDPEVIKNYVVKRKEPITKIVFSSVVTGKLFNSKQAVIEDFTKNQLKSLELVEVPNQNRYQIEEHFLSFIQTELDESKISSFVESASKIEDLSQYMDQWLEDASESE
ncbi:MAG TPA: DUF2709 domain-containing protein [Rhabdochlamydiaceae bacterium]|jgi:hypothetical protein|nr:DUF2709 domain-containing protein [Rhabdochlamydiaceae bacterium]